MRHRTGRHRESDLSPLSHEPNYIERRSKFKRCCIFFVPIYILVIFIIISSGIYFAIERDCRTNFWCPAALNIIVLNNLPENITRYLNETQIDAVKKNHSFGDNLNYWEAVHFIIITISTIGYGDIVPCTYYGQVVAMISAIIGMPIMFFSLARFGQSFGIMLHRLWKTIYTRLFKPPYSEHRQRQLANMNYVPLSAGICITLIWILICAFYFYMTLNEEYIKDGRRFNYINSLYFTMVSFLTIGFGEYAPIRYELIWPNMAMLMIGLSLVALCIRLFQSNMEDMIDNFVDKIDRDFNEDVEVETNTDHKFRPETGTEAVKHFMDQKRHSSDVVTKVLAVSMSGSQEKRLAQLYDEKLKFVNESSQTITVDNCDVQVQVVQKGRLERNASLLSCSHVACQVAFDEEDENHGEEFDDFEFIDMKSPEKKKKKHYNSRGHNFRPKRLRRHSST